MLKPAIAADRERHLREQPAHALEHVAHGHRRHVGKRADDRILAAASPARPARARSRPTSSARRRARPATGSRRSSSRRLCQSTCADAHHLGLHAHALDVERDRCRRRRPPSFFAISSSIETRGRARASSAVHQRPAITRLPSGGAAAVVKRVLADRGRTAPPPGAPRGDWSTRARVTGCVADRGEPRAHDGRQPRRHARGLAHEALEGARAGPVCTSTKKNDGASRRRS